MPLADRLRSLAALVALCALRALAWPLLHAPLHAQGTIVARDAGARVERLAEGVYAIIHDDAVHDWPSGVTDWPHGNTGVIVGPDGVLVVDATYFPSRARADIALVRAITDRPVRWLVNTHWHGDHTHGNGVYREAFPGLVIVGQRENREFIAVNQERFPLAANADGSPQRATVRYLESVRASGKDSAGRAITADERGRLDRVLAERRAELAELASVKVAPPDLLFDQSLTLWLGQRRVELRDHGHANSPHDLTVYLPAERVLFTGDIVVHPVPYAFQAYPLPWIGVLRELEAMPVTSLVPGHGPVMTDHAYTRQVRELLEATRDRVQAQLRTGKNAVQAGAAVNLDDLRPRFVKPGDVNMAEYWKVSIVEALPERMAACILGMRC
jgi:glyoxylase-like metal-dependent hydrolase (beta-lactamase superfamily II)